LGPRFGEFGDWERKQLERSRAIEERKWFDESVPPPIPKDHNLRKWGNLGEFSLIPIREPSGASGWGETYGPKKGEKAKVGQTAKKSGLSWKNFMNAAGKLKSPTGMDFGRVSGRAGGSRPRTPSPRALGVDAAQMAAGGDPRKKFWEQGLWRGIMG
jgi:hypothetical protein